MKTCSPELQCIAHWLSTVADLQGMPAPAPGVTIDPVRWRRLLEDNQLVPLWMASAAADRLDFLPESLKTPPVEWVQAYLQSGRQAALRHVVLRQVGQLLDGQIDIVVLKGMTLSPSLYTEAAARPMRDIDLLCENAAAREQVRDRLCAAGFQMMQRDLIHHHLPPIFDPAGRVSIELHDNLLTPSLPAACMAELWSRRQRSGALPGISHFDPAAAWFHHALHSVSDPVDSPLLRDLFEVAWMSRRLSLDQRATAFELATLSGREAIVRQAVNVAADLFGGEPGGGDTRGGAIERWCRRRLEWTRPESVTQRFMQHVGRERFNRMCERPQERNPFPWLWQCTRGLLHRCGRALGSSHLSRKAWYRRPQYPFVRVDGHALIRNIDTRSVHMLNERTTALWDAAAEPVRLGDLQRNPRAGSSPAERAEALRVLLENGLLVRAQQNG